MTESDNQASIFQAARNSSSGRPYALQHNVYWFFI